MKLWKARGARGKQFARRGVGVLCLDMLNLRCILSGVPERNPIRSSLSKEELTSSLTESPGTNPAAVARLRDAGSVMRTHAHSLSLCVSPSHSFSLNTGFSPRVSLLHMAEKWPLVALSLYLSSLYSE